MKLLIFLLGLAVCHSLPCLGSYQMVDTLEARTNIQIQTLLNFGLETILQEGLQKEELSSTSDFKVSQILSVYRQLIDKSGEENYKFSCEFDNGQGQTIIGSFEIHYQASTNTKTILSSSYQIKTITLAEKVGQTFVQVSSLEVEYSNEVRNIVTFGANELTKRAISRDKIPNFSYSISNVTSVYRQVVQTAFFYTCVVSLTNNEGVTIEAVFTVYYQPLFGTKSLIDYSYQAFQQSQQEVATASGATSNTGRGRHHGFLGEVKDKIKNIVSNIFDHSDDSSSDDGGSNTITNVNTETSVDIDVTIANETVTEVVFQPIEGQYVQIYISDTQNKSEVQDILNYGIQEIINISLEEEKITTFDFVLTEIEAAYNQIMGNGLFYKFICKLVNNEGKIIQTTFTTYYQIITQQINLTSYSYEILVEESDGFIPSSEIPTPEFEETLQDQEDNFIDIGIEEVQQNSEIYNILEYGVDIVIKDIISNNEIQTGSFMISNVIQASVKSEEKGDTYAFTCQAKNQEGMVIKMSFTVYYSFSLSVASVSSYTFTVQSVESTKTYTEPAQTINGNYSLCKDEDIEASTIIQNILSYGATQIQILGAQEGDIPVTQFSIDTIISVYQKVAVNGIFYKCEVTLKDENEINLFATFTVFYHSSTQQMILSQHSYQIKEAGSSSGADSINSSESDIDLNTNKDVTLEDATYVEVNTSSIDYVPEIKSCLDYGVEQLVIQSNEYTVNQINSIYRQVVQNALYYKFDLELGNQGAGKMKLTFTIYYKPDTDIKYINAYSYQIVNTSTTSNYVPSNLQYERIDASELEHNSQYQSTIDYGVQECVKNLVNYNVVVASDFQISQVKDAFKQQTSTSENYVFKIKLISSAGISLDIGLTVQYEKSTGQKFLTSYLVEGSSTTQKDVLIVDCNTQEEKLEISSWGRIDALEVKMNSEIQAAVDYGVQEVTKNVIQLENVSYNDFTIQAVKNVYREVVNAQNYRIEAILANSEGLNIDCSFSINYQASLGLKEMTSFSYLTY